MAAETFTPVNILELYCRFCKKTIPAKLERSIAGSGRIVDKESTFEYICSKCHRAHCYHGKDLIQDLPESDDAKNTNGNPRKYTISGHFYIGEKISHPSHETDGLVVGKEPGNPNRVIVKFDKIIASLVEDVN